MNQPAPRPAILGAGPGPWDDVRHWLVLAPHPDDFDVVAVTLRHFADAGARLSLEVLSGGASGVEDVFAKDWETKTTAREAEQRESCARFGLPADHLHFNRLTEDAEGHMADTPENGARVHGLLDIHAPDGVILPHGNDSNADHRRTFRWFHAWCENRTHPPLALLVRDPKNLGMRVDLITPYDSAQAGWKAALLRCHRSQHERNLRSRGTGFDERILASDRAAARPFGITAAESFEVHGWGFEPQPATALTV
jgi:LmbE family N-acetylglucosaminyl deacetylase